VGGKKFFGEKCLILGKKHYFVWKTTLKAPNDYMFQKFGGGHGSPLATPMADSNIIQLYLTLKCTKDQSPTSVTVS